METAIIENKDCISFELPFNFSINLLRKKLKEYEIDINYNMDFVIKALCNKSFDCKLRVFFYSNTKSLKKVQEIVAKEIVLMLL